MQRPPTPDRKVVSNASAVLAAGDTAREFLAIQNQSTTATISILSGSAQVATEGWKVPPGGNVMLEGLKASGSWYAISLGADATVELMLG